jgi:hypothetical protein
MRSLPLSLNFRTKAPALSLAGVDDEDKETFHLYCYDDLVSWGQSFPELLRGDEGRAGGPGVAARFCPA